VNDLTATARDGFVFGYPLVLMDITRSVFLNVVAPDGTRNVSNRLSHRRRFPDASFTTVVSPNPDTLYSTAWIDVSSEPVVLSAPASDGRYYLLPLMSAWTDIFASPGSRTTGEGPGTFAITGPGPALPGRTRPRADGRSTGALAATGPTISSVAMWRWSVSAPTSTRTPCIHTRAMDQIVAFLDESGSAAPAPASEKTSEARP
jgi:Protein of unknown function (DUF1254)